MLINLIEKHATLQELQSAVEKKGADINEVGPHGYSALDVAIDDRRYEVVQWLLEKGAALENHPLYFAAKRGNVDIVRYCIDAGLDVNERFHKDGYTALMVAVSEAHEYLSYERREGEGDLYPNFALIVEALIGAGANPNLANDSQQTPLHAAGHFGELECARLILEGSDLLKKRVNLNPEDVYGLTPLHFACRAGNLKVAELLLSWGADPNVQEKYGFTPLHEAVENNHIEIVRLLLRNGADKKLTTNVDFKPYYVGTSPLDIAKMRQYNEIATLLVDK